MASLSLLLTFSVATASAQEADEPCSLLTIEEVAAWTGITVENTLPQGNLTAIATCTFGGVARPPVLSYGLTVGSAARGGYEGMQDWPGVSAVEGVGLAATWVPFNRTLAVLAREDLYLFVRLDDRNLREAEAAQQELAKEVVALLVERLPG